MLNANYIILFAVIISLSMLYQKYIEKQSRVISVDAYSEIRKYLLRDKPLDNIKKPLLWIHIPQEYNSRNWSSFGSRSSHDLNQPYLYLTVKSIIKNCDESFKIVMIDDGSFEKLIPEWNVNMSMISDPIKCYIRQFAMAKLLYNYGGIHVPISFLCFRDLIGLYKSGTRDDSMFICENYDSNFSSTNNLFSPDARFMGSKKNDETMKKFIGFMENLISRDYTAESSFVGYINKWCDDNLKSSRLLLIRGTDVGTKTNENNVITIETLLSNDYINFNGKMYGIWIPDKMILKRRKYEWFSRMSPEQIFESQFILAKYFVLALAPDSDMGVIEPLENKPDWISFWRVPLTNGTLNVYGHRPIGLGNNVPSSNSTGTNV